MGEEKKKKICIIVSKGTLDMAYPPLILASIAAALDWEAHLFFTFWGMDIITKKKVDKLKISAVGNPNIPMPNILAVLPGMNGMVTGMMKKTLNKVGFPSIRELIKECKENGVKFYACEPTMKAFGLSREDLLDEVDDIIGAATFLELASDANVTLFV